MLYIVSGASRAGKSIIAKRILQDKQIPYMSLDWLVMGFTFGLPEVGIHDKLMPDVIAEKLWVYLKPILDNMVWSGIDYVIEGEAILPNLIRDYAEKHPGSMEICFLGYVNVDKDRKLSEIRKFNIGQGDWLNEEDDASVLRHIDNMVHHSRLIQESCEKHNVRYFDTSLDFLKAVDEATRYLLRNI